MTRHAPARTLLAVLGLCSLAAGTAEARDPKVEQILARFEDEPTVRDVQKEAIEYYNVSPEKISSLRKRARLKALVPGLSAGFTGFQQSSALAVDDIIYRGLGTARYEDLNNASMAFNVSATWSLDRLIFNAEELDVISLIGIQDGIQREVTTLYYVRRRLQIELLLAPPTTIEARVSAELRLEELTGLADEDE